MLPRLLLYACTLRQTLNEKFSHNIVLSINVFKVETDRIANSELKTRGAKIIILQIRECIVLKIKYGEVLKELKE